MSIFQNITHNLFANKKEKLILIGLSLTIGTIINSSFLRKLEESAIDEINRDRSADLNDLSVHTRAIFEDAIVELSADAALLLSIGYGTHLILKNVCGIDAFKSI